MEIREKLSKFISENGLKKSFVAKQLGITPSIMSYYLHGDLLMANKIDKKVLDFLTKYET